MRRFISYGPALVVLLTVVVVLMGAPAAIYRIRAAETQANIVLAQRELDDGTTILEQLNRAIQQVATAVKPSVVSLEVSATGRGRMRSTGSGWVYDGRGHIITNAHVVRGADTIAVEFSDGRIVEVEKVNGELYLADPFTDVAVIKVGTDTPLFPARRATGVKPEVGDRVFAFGSPFGFKFSMSEGIVSGLGRAPGAAVLTGGFTNFIQTDAAVNPGNSGGPLVDVRGRVIGMNVAIATGKESDGTTEGQSAGISFAIPLLTIESVAEQLIKSGTVRRGYLGVQWSSSDDPVVYVPEIGKRGVQVIGLPTGSPAAAAGVMIDDIITAIGGDQIISMEGLRSLVTSFSPGQEVEVRGLRQGKPVEFRVVLGEYPRKDLAVQGAGTALLRYGLWEFRGPELSRSKSVVRRVIEGSEADKAGFQPGMVVVRVGEYPVDNWEQVAVAAADSGLLLGRSVPFVVVEPGESESKPPQVIDVLIPR
jgi:serine protease Do